MTAAAMTYDSLVTDISGYSERANDAVFVAQIPRIIMMAENKIARSVRNLGLVRFVTSAFSATNPILPKPARWRQTVSFNVTLASGARQYLFPRSYDYCRSYWPTQSSTDTPVYYADYDYEHYFIAPTPATGLTFEIAYHERPEPLSDANQTSWTTQYAPQLLLYACMVEASTYLKNMDKVQMWQGLTDNEIKGLAGEESERAGDDRATKRVQA